MKNELTQEYVRSLFNYKNGVLYWKVNRSNVKAGSVAGNRHHSGYWKICLDGKAICRHRIVFLWHHGYLPKKPFEIDHIDRKKPYNDRIENLREISHSQNLMNRGKQKDNTSGYKNIHLHEKLQKWQVQIRKNGIYYYGGVFANIKDAVKARDKLGKELHGEFWVAD